jgi:hypothetical protein
MVVLEPLKVTITNFPAGIPMELTVPNFPSDESRGSHTIVFDSVIYIEKSDFTEVRAMSLLIFSRQTDSFRNQRKTTRDLHQISHAACDMLVTSLQFKT